jgi:acyl phosphate:glycerol-3-phosphate acyltransferase
MNLYSFSLILIAAYLLGSVCSAIIVCKLCKLPDPRDSGSKNPGATNVLRLSGKNYAFIVLCGDFCKSLLPMLIAHSYGLSLNVIAYIGLCAIMGHIYPVFFKFQGGKGVATTLGVLFGINPILGLLSVLTWLVVAKIFKYSSLAAILAISAAPFYALLLLKSPLIFCILLSSALLVIYKHKENIVRLYNNSESKI